MPIIAESSTAWLQFQKGDTDYSSQLPPGQVAVAETNPKVKSGKWTAKAYPNLGVYFVGMNMRQDARAPTWSSARPSWSRLTPRTSSTSSTRASSIPATGYVPVGIPGLPCGPEPVHVQPGRRQGAHRRDGHVPTLQYWYNTDEGHQKIAEVLQAGWAEGRHQGRAQQLRVGHVPRQAVQGQRTAVSSSAWAGWPTTRRWTTSCTRCSSRRRPARAATRSTRTTRSTPCFSRRAPPLDATAASQPVRAGGEAGPHGHARRPAVLLPRLPRDQ